jgi:hypothetical protein
MQKRFLTMVVLSLCMCGAASAAAPNWTGDFDNNFMAPLNWDDQVAPVDGDSLTIVPGQYYQPVYMNTNTSTTGSAYINSGATLTVNSGVLRLTKALADSGALAVYNRSLTTYGVTINSGGILRCGQNVYVGGHGNGTGSVLINAGGRLECSATTTVGYNSSTAEGKIVVYGTLDCGVGLRIDPSVATAKACMGIIDVRSSGMAYVDANFVVPAGSNPIDQMNQLISNGRFVSEPGYVPVVSDANGTLVAGKRKIVVTAQQVYYAGGPSPVATGAHETYSSSQTLSWVKPLPRIAGETVTSDVYFGTTNPPTTKIADNTAGSSVTVTTQPQATYYWKVDSRDSNGGSPIVTSVPGNPWTFDTMIAPTCTAGTANRRMAAFRNGGTDPNTTVTMVSTATDDGYPAAVTYTWTVASPQEPNVIINNANSPTPVIKMNTKTPPVGSVTQNGTTTTFAANDYGFGLDVFDGSQHGYTYVSVRIYDLATNPSAYCDAYKWVHNSDSATLAGDLNNDCKVDGKDFAAFVLNWLACNSADCI